MFDEAGKAWNVWSNAQWAEREGDKGADHVRTWGAYRMERAKRR